MNTKTIYVDQKVILSENVNNYFGCVSLDFSNTFLQHLCYVYYFYKSQETYTRSITQMNI